MEPDLTCWILSQPQRILEKNPGNDSFLFRIVQDLSGSFRMPRAFYITGSNVLDSIPAAKNPGRESWNRILKKVPGKESWNWNPENDSINNNNKIDNFVSFWYEKGGHPVTEAEVGGSGRIRTERERGTRAKEQLPDVRNCQLMNGLFRLPTASSYVFPLAQGGMIMRRPLFPIPLILLLLILLIWLILILSPPSHG